MNPCQWYDLTGLDCSEAATHNVYDRDHQRQIELCATHYSEFLRDMQERANR